MEKVELTAEKLRSLLDYDHDTGEFRWKVSPAHCVKPGDIAGGISQGYVKVAIDGKSYLGHRLAWLYQHGEWPNGNLDHKDRDRSNNRIANLRLGSCAENAQNRLANSNNKSGVKGVYWNPEKLKWYSQITINYRLIHLGYSSSIEEAKKARELAESKYQPFRPVT